MQDTSLKAFADIKPTLGVRQRAVFLIIREHGAITNNEIAHILKRPINEVTPRTNELVKMNYVALIGRRPCKITGKTCIEWGEIKETLW